MRKGTSVFFNSLVISLLLLLASGSAFAQATRTWVSGVGDDVNPCSRTAPCKTFAGAISKTAAGGIINCIDPGGFGAVTITKSMTISCKHVEGSILASGTTGVILNGAGINVVLRGLEIDGGTPTTPGYTGIRFIQGNSLTVEDCTIRNFTQASPYGVGIRVETSSGLAKLDVVNTMFTNNGSGDGATGGAGIWIIPSGSADVDATISNSNFHNNINGIRADSTSTTGSIDVEITDTRINNSAAYGISLVAPTRPVRFMLDHVSSLNGDQGIRSNGPWAQVRMGNSVVTGNTFGLQTANSGVIQSYGTNRINGNGADGGVTTVAQK